MDADEGRRSQIVQNPEEFRERSGVQKEGKKARSAREWVQTGGIQELNGWRERSWAQSEGDRGGGGGEVLRREGRREGGRDGGGRFYLIFFHT